MTKVVVDLLGAGFCTFTIILFYDTFWSRKRVKRSLLISAYVLAAVSNVVITALLPNSLFLALTTYAILFLLSFLYASHISSKVLFSCCAMAAIIIPEVAIGYLIVTIQGIPGEELQANLAGYALGMLMKNLFSLLIVYIVKTIFSGKKMEADRQSNLLMAFMPLQAIVLCLIASGYIAGIDLLQSATLVIIAVTISLSLVAIMMYMLNRQLKAMVYMKEYEIAQNILEEQIGHYQKLNETQHEVKAIRHEISNNLIAISGMLREGVIDDAIEHIDKIYGSIIKTSEVVNTGFPPIDAVLTAKIGKASENGITVEHKLMISDELNIDQLDLAMIVASALDNAIEGVSRSHGVDKKVWISISSQNDNISLLVENYASEKPDEGFRTVKRDKQNHGFGLVRMRTIASQYDGDVEPSFDNESGKFTLRVFLRNIAC